MKPTGRSQRMREELRRRREAFGWSRAEVGRRVADELGRESAYSDQAVKYWEEFKRHPPVDVYAAWARVLGKRLLVNIGDAADDSVPVNVKPTAADAVREFALLDDRDARYIRRLLALLPSMDERDRRLLDRELEFLEQEIAERSPSRSAR